MFLTVLVGLIAATASPPDTTAAVYEAILREIRVENPGSQIVLATTRSSVRCMPLCGAFGDEPVDGGEDHPGPLLRRLRESGAIDTTCVVKPRTFGCRREPNTVFVALGPLTDDTPEGGARHPGAVWVLVAIIRPIAGGDEPYGYRVLVEGAADCTWRIVRKRMEFMI